ncbi:hypothetical protein [Limisphaera sp. 4302-co]|uniref:hypothetical protein n=1 Tax=Limisphaera sp. 4302-co TaxID=3400417 RepID=UPI003C275B77
MKSILREIWVRIRPPRTLFRWGEAELVRWPDGRLRLHGGTDADRQAALEWASLFAHEVIPVKTPAPRPARRQTTATLPRPWPSPSPSPSQRSLA